MKKFRQSVLASAFKGELVPQDPNDEPASLLLEKIRREKGLQSKTYFGMSELVLEKNNQNNPSGWEFVPLSQIAEINPKMQNGKINSELRVSFVPMKCVEELSGQIDLSNSRKYEEVKRGYTYFANGDILFAKITPCMENGKIVIAKNLKNGIGFGSTEFHVVRLFNKNMPREFYFWYLMQDKFRNNARHNMKGTAGQLRVPVSFIENSIVPVPPVNEQKRIVAKIEELFSFATQIEKSVEEAKKRVDKIDQAILAKAFRGELVPQDPNDEPASVLLERIMKEKEIKQTVQRKPRKSR
jgi:type I restriction enzyme S subunit